MEVEQEQQREVWLVDVVGLKPLALGRIEKKQRDVEQHEQAWWEPKQQQQLLPAQGPRQHYYHHHRFPYVAVAWRPS